MTKDFQEAIDDIEAVRLKFHNWRSQRKFGTRIPEELWNLAIELTFKHPIGRVCRILGLNFVDLKHRVHGVHGVQSKENKEYPSKSSIGSSPFIELKVGDPPPPSRDSSDSPDPIPSILGFVSGGSQGSQCLMELSRADGTTMRIYSTAVSSSIDITGICESFLKS